MPPFPRQQPPAPQLRPLHHRHLLSEKAPGGNDRIVANVSGWREPWASASCQAEMQAAGFVSNRPAAERGWAARAALHARRQRAGGWKRSAASEDTPWIPNGEIGSPPAHFPEFCCAIRPGIDELPAGISTDWHLVRTPGADTWSTVLTRLLLNGLIRWQRCLPSSLNGSRFKKSRTTAQHLLRPRSRVCINLSGDCQLGIADSGRDYSENVFAIGTMRRGSCRGCHSAHFPGLARGTEHAASVNKIAIASEKLPTSSPHTTFWKISGQFHDSCRTIPMSGPLACWPVTPICLANFPVRKGGLRLFRRRPVSPGQGSRLPTAAVSSPTLVSPGSRNTLVKSCMYIS